MIEKIVNKKKLSQKDENSALQYWLKKTPEERIEAVELLRRQHDGNTERLQRTVRVIKRTQS